MVTNRKLFFVLLIMAAQEDARIRMGENPQQGSLGDKIKNSD